MHPYLSGLMAEAHREDLLREANQHRLAWQVRAGRPHRLAQWQTGLTQVADRARLRSKPTLAAVVACAPQPVCCPA